MTDMIDKTRGQFRPRHRRDAAPGWVIPLALIAVTGWFAGIVTAALAWGLL